jgi:hypothetical protein
MNPNVEKAATTPASPEAYQPPQVEAVLDSASLAREVHYAGRISDPS